MSFFSSWQCQSNRWYWKLVPVSVLLSLPFTVSVCLLWLTLMCLLEMLHIFLMCPPGIFILFFCRIITVKTSSEDIKGAFVCVTWSVGAFRYKLMLVDVFLMFLFNHWNKWVKGEKWGVEKEKREVNYSGLENLSWSLAWTYPQLHCSYNYNHQCVLHESYMIDLHK